MRCHIFIRFVAVVALPFLFAGCESASDSLPINAANLSETALQGKRIFDNKNCIKCHTLGKSMMTVVKQGKEVIIPDLTNPFIATDSSYVKTHLQFQEESDMPVIKLSNTEIRAVSRFIAELHAATHGKELLDGADTVCPVCQAKVNSAKARQLGLWFTYLNDTYSFECKECKALFADQPLVYQNQVTVN